MKSRNSERERESALYHFYTLHASTLQNTSNKECSTQKTQRRITFIHLMAFFFFPHHTFFNCFNLNMPQKYQIEEEKNKLYFQRVPKLFVLLFFLQHSMCLFSVPRRFVLSPKQKQKFSLFSSSNPKFLVFFMCSSFGVV